VYFHEHRKNTVKALLAVFILPLLKRHFETPRGGAAGFSHSSFDLPPKPAVEELKGINRRNSCVQTFTSDLWVIFPQKVNQSLQEQ